MDISIPVYVYTEKPSGAREPLHVCAPVFNPRQTARHEMLPRAMQKLARDVRRQLESAAKLPHHGILARLAFNPELKAARHKLQLDLRDRTLRVNYLLVEMKSLGRRIAFTPSLPDLWFELERGEKLKERATEVLEDYFLRLNRDDAEAFLRAAATSLTGKAWLSALDLDISAKQKTRKEQQQEWAALWQDEEIDGSDELHKVGRCLDWLYPDDLSPAIGRGTQVDELQSLLAAPDRRPVAVVGKRLAGKTAVIHQAVFRRVAALRKKNRNRRNVWLLSPGRLISGMSYVGQWENRLLAIIKEARKKDHVLYFDDPLGLYSAGKSADSGLCMADVLKPRIARREIRMLAEMTPEAFDALQQRDRGLADEFHVLRIDETDEQATLEVLLEVNRRYEAQHRCRFELDVLPTVIEIQHRYAPAEAFPGKAARMLSRLATRHRGVSNGEAWQSVERNDVFDEFHRQTGMRLELIDQRRKLPHREIIDGLRRRMVGQAPAVDAAAEIIALAKARLNTPRRPLAAMLFLGPTGVGKTECAKAIARFLFSDEKKLLRFDMNEFSGPFDAARLVGTFAEPDGLLTGAVRRQPFSVVLFDEIEKAHPDVFDLLLQVMGEGRLTDAVGRTTDFSNTIVILTSNLGTREAGSAAGFGSQQQETQLATFIRSAEQFFSPELFNRFDRVIPFGQLSRDELKLIAEHLIREVFQREGLVRRRCLLHVDRQAMETVIDRGYHPQYGARALKRTIESELTLPVARALAGMTSSQPTLIRLFQHGHHIKTLVDELNEARPVVARTELAGERLDAMLTAAEGYLREVSQALEPLRPEGGITAGSLTAEQLHYFALKEQHAQAAELLEQARAEREHEAKSVLPPAIAPATTTRTTGKLTAYMEHGSTRRVLLNIYSADDIDDYVNEFAREGGDAREQQSRQQRLRDEFALLVTMTQCEPEGNRLLLLFEPLAGVRERQFNEFMTMYEQLCREELDLDCQPTEVDATYRACEVGGACAQAILAGEAGLHVFVDADDSLSGVNLHLLPLEDDDSQKSDAVENSNGWLAVESAGRRPRPEAQRRIDSSVDRSTRPPATRPEVMSVLKRFDEQRADWLANPHDEARTEDHPYRIGKVLRVFRANQGVLDLRTRLTTANGLPAAKLRQMILGGLPSPPGWEVSDAIA